MQEALDKISATGTRTTIAIAHRLSTISHANRIFVFEQGRIAEAGNHIELMSIPNGRYAELVRLQQLEG